MAEAQKTQTADHTLVLSPVPGTPDGPPERFPSAVSFFLFITSFIISAVPVLSVSENTIRYSSSVFSYPSVAAVSFRIYCSSHSKPCSAYVPISYRPLCASPFSSVTSVSSISPYSDRSSNTAPSSGRPVFSSVFFTVSLPRTRSSSIITCCISPVSSTSNSACSAIQ